MAKESTPTFIYTCGLKMSDGDTRHLMKALGAARYVYNKLLEEGLTRVRLYRESKAFQKAVSVPKEKKKLRKQLFEEAMAAMESHHKVTITISGGKRGCLSKADRTRLRVERTLRNSATRGCLDKFATQFNCSWPSNYIDSQVIKKLSLRASTVIADHLYKHTEVRFKSAKDFNSIEGINNKQSIRLRAIVDKSQPVGSRGRYGDATYLGEGHCVVYKGREYPLHYKRGLDDCPFTLHAKTSRVKYCRLVLRYIGSKPRFFVQFALEGLPYEPKREDFSPPKDVRHLGEGVVGIDIGPSLIATVTDDKATLRTFCEGLERIDARKKRLQRTLARMRRANNPDRYEEDTTQRHPKRKERRKQGKNKKGRGRWVRSKRELRVINALKGAERAHREHRKSVQGYAVNQLLKQGSVFKTEDVSVRSWAALWGKSVGHYAPAGFLARLEARVQQYGGEFVRVPTKTTALSRTCHACGKVEPKGLSVRWHRCECGVVAQRDLYSAYLVRHASAEGLDFDAAAKEWPQQLPNLQACMNQLRNAKQSGERFPASFGV